MLLSLCVFFMRQSLHERPSFEIVNQVSYAPIHLRFFTSPTSPARGPSPAFSPTPSASAARTPPSHQKGVGAGLSWIELLACNCDVFCTGVRFWNGQVVFFQALNMRFNGFMNLVIPSCGNGLLCGINQSRYLREMDERQRKAFQ